MPRQCWLAYGRRRPDRQSTLGAGAHRHRPIRTEGPADHDDAVAAVDALAALLEATQDEPDVETPNKWDDDKWDEAVEVACEKADIAPSKGTLTTKTIDEREYCYMQWREGESVKSQYVSPVEPA
ncbi:hypothetical protein [Haloarcula sp. JP-L23]|uniref:hypothetical protein n=1 Tax=Haloarcula sp. JP-L23 TaxID=2716717 RepID=UPI001D049D67